MKNKIKNCLAKGQQMQRHDILGSCIWLKTPLGFSSSAIK